MFNRWLLKLLPLSIGLCMGTVAYGAPYTVSTPDPQSFDELSGITQGEVPGDLMRAQCGGFNFELGVEDYMSEVEGVPGRKGIWDGNLQSGMGERNMDDGFFDDGYLFPKIKEAAGLSTACRMEDLLRGNFKNPERLENCEEEEDCNQFCTDMNNYHYKITDISKTCEDRTGQGWEAGWAYCCTGDLVPEPGTRTPNDPEFLAENCIACHGDGAVRMGETRDYNDETIKREIRDQVGCRWGRTIDQLKADTFGGPEPEGDIPLGATKLPDPHGGDLAAKAAGSEGAKRYVSFFREYLASYNRTKLSQHVPFDKNQRSDIGLQCFGQYREGMKTEDGEDMEFDAKYYKVEDDELLCLVAADFSPYAQSQKVAMKKELMDPESDNPPSPVVDRDFNEEEDLWFPHAGDALSLINQKLLDKKYDSNLSFPLLAPDGANQVGTVQISEEIPLSSGSLLRAFDDTVTTDEKNEKMPDPTGRDDRRTVVEWWQEMETAANTLMTPPMVRIFLPALWPLGLDAFDPMFTPPQQGSSSSATERDPQTQSIEIQLNAKEDTLGEIAAYLKRSLIAPIEEEPIVLAIPSGSPSDYRAAIETWCAWYKKMHNKNDCDGAEEPGLHELMEQLENYAQRIDYARKLRGELALYAGKVLEKQNIVGTGVKTWLETNMAEYKAYVENRIHPLVEGVAGEEDIFFADRWREVQKMYRDMDTDTMPWCRSDRFTTPIYSLNRWFPGWPNVTGGLYDEEDEPAGANDLPQLKAERETNVILDFTALKVPKKAILLPVLKPLQVRIEQQLLSQPTGKPGEQFIPKLPDLKEFEDMPSIATDEIMDKLIPEIEEGDAPQTIGTYIPEAAAFDAEEIVKTLDATEKLLEDMIKVYTAFWAGVLNNVIPPECNDGKDNDEDGYTDFGADSGCDSLTDPKEEDRCTQHGTLPCVYLEQELMQAMGRISGRPAVLLKEDIESIGERRDPAMDEGGYDSCPREDWVCQLQNKEFTYPRMGWQITEIQGQHEAIDEVRTDVFMQTLDPENGQEFPFMGGREEILPSYNMPIEIQLIPSGSSSSSSS